MVQIIPICSGRYVFLVRRQHDGMKQKAIEQCQISA